jgi:3-hydroxybutyryl-CoA dehydrogenase
MAAGDLGLKTGKGFYDFEKIDVEAYRHEKMATFVALLRHLDLLAKPGGS